MTQLIFLSPAEKRQFDSPPVLTKAQRPAYFAVTDDIRKTLGSLRTPTTRVGFLLQIGYFKHSGKFFERSVFRQRDIRYITELLGLSESIDFSEYRPSSMTHHQSLIRNLLGWTAFNTTNASLIAEHVQLQAQQQIKPEEVFTAAVDFCWQQRIELPSHNQLAQEVRSRFV